jgi:glucokinase-like ROK family protein
MTAFQLIKEINIKRIIKLIREKEHISRVEISEQMNIPQPTITRIIDELLKENILKEDGLGHSTGGRRPVLLTFNHQCYYSVGVELGRSDIKVALTDLDGKILSLRMKETKRTEKITTIINLVKNALSEIVEEAQIDRSRLLGVGVGLPGPLNETEDGLISPPNFYGEKDIPLRDLLQEALQFPVIIDNDANVATLAEKWFGKGIGYNNYVYVMADVGIGSGIIINGNLHRGLYGESGEIGHSTIDIFGEKCSCGNYGCLETLASIPKIEETVKRKLKMDHQEKESAFAKEIEAVSFEDIVSALQRGSATAKQTFEETGRFLSVGIANLINLFAPEIVIIGGKLGLSDPILLEAIKANFRARVLGSGGKTIDIVTSDFKEGVVLGAAALVINDTFSFSSIA